MRPLDPDEEEVLRRLEEQLREDAPRLVKQLNLAPPSVLQRLAPTSWAPRVFVTIGIVLIVLGVALNVGSSVLGGLLSTGLAWLRWWYLNRWLAPKEPDDARGSSSSHRRQATTERKDEGA